MYMLQNSLMGNNINPHFVIFYHVEQSLKKGKQYKLFLQKRQIFVYLLVNIAFYAKH